VATTNIINVNVFGNRLFMVEKNTLKIWYLPIQSIAGAATAFDLSTIFGRGGYLMAMGTWSVDAGNGMNDLAVFVSSELRRVNRSRASNPSAPCWASPNRGRRGLPVSQPDGSGQC